MSVSSFASSTSTFFPCTAFRFIHLHLSSSPLCLPISSHLRSPLSSFAKWYQIMRKPHQHWDVGRGTCEIKNTVDTTEKWREPCTTRHTLSFFFSPIPRFLGKCPCMGIDCRKVLFFSSTTTREENTDKKQKKTSYTPTGWMYHRCSPVSSRWVQWRCAKSKMKKEKYHYSPSSP